MDISFISSMKIYHTFKFLNYLINPQQNYNKFENTYTRNVSTYISITLSLNTKKLVTNYNVYNINFWISIFSYQLAKYIRLVIFIFFLFRYLPLSCGRRTRYRVETVSSRKSTDSVDDIQSPLIPRWMKTLKGVWNEQLRDKWKIFLLPKKRGRRERKRERERGRKKLPESLSRFFTPLEQRGSGMNVSVQYSLCVSPFTSIITSSVRKEFSLQLSREYRKVFAEGFHHLDL